MMSRASAGMAGSKVDGAQQGTRSRRGAGQGSPDSMGSSLAPTSSSSVPTTSRRLASSAPILWVETCVCVCVCVLGGGAAHHPRTTGRRGVMQPGTRSRQQARNTLLNSKQAKCPRVARPAPAAAAKLLLLLLAVLWLRPRTWLA
jgi:hypothetical protein